MSLNFWGCSTLPSAPPEPIEPIQPPVKVKIKKNQRVIKETTIKKNKKYFSKMKNTYVISHPADLQGEIIDDGMSVIDSGYTRGRPIKIFRRGLTAFNAENFQIAFEEFTNFLRQYPKHPFSGNSQFYLALSYYFLDKEKLAINEFKKIVSHYSRNEKIFDTINILSLISNDDESKKTIQKLNESPLFFSMTHRLENKWIKRIKQLKQKNTKSTEVSHE